MLTPHHLQPRHADLPTNSDPADLLADGRTPQLLDALDHAGPLADTLITERINNLPAATAALESMAVIAARPVDDWEPALHTLADRLGVDTTTLRDTQHAYIQAFNDNPQRFTDSQLATISAVRDRLAAAALAQRWVPLADSIDPRLRQSASWPA